MRTSNDRMAEWQASSADQLLPALVEERDYSDLNDAIEQLRVWLPHPAKLALDAICSRRGITMTAHLTEFFVSYLYGYYELLRMRESRTGLYRPVNRKCSMMAAHEEEQPKLGKNIFAIKMFMPETLKQALQESADKTGSKLGVFVRALICTHLFGRKFAPDSLLNFSVADLRAADSWEQDDD